MGSPAIPRRVRATPALDGEDLAFDRMSSRIGSWDFKDMDQVHRNVAEVVA